MKGLVSTFAPTCHKLRTPRRLVGSLQKRPAIGGGAFSDRCLLVRVFTNVSSKLAGESREPADVVPHMDEITTLTDEELLKRLHGWRLPPSPAPLPHNRDIEAASLAEYEALRLEAGRRELPTGR